MATKVVVVAKSSSSGTDLIMFGTLIEHDRSTGTVVLERARQAFYPGRKSGGAFGLAVNGPTKDNRLSPIAPGRSEVAGVVLITDATPEATAVWEAPPSTPDQEAEGAED